eukprot:9165441-Alexandrium_andersonii.AAC.1
MVGTVILVWIRHAVAPSMGTQTNRCDFIIQYILTWAYSIAHTPEHPPCQMCLKRFGTSGAEVLQQHANSSVGA